MNTKLRLLVLSDSWPSVTHTIRAANIVMFELLNEFVKHENIDVGFLKFNNPSASGEVSPGEKEGTDVLIKKGVEILEPLSFPPRKQTSKLRHLSMLVNPRLEDWYPEIIHQKTIEERISEFSPDMLFVPWSEWVAGLCSEIKIPKFAYYGNPDPKVGLARSYFSFYSGDMNFLNFLRLKYLMSRFEKLHLKVMKRYEILGEMAMNDVDYYVKRGHPNAFYLQNLWVDRFGVSWREKRKIFEKENPAIIIGSIGKVFGTANQYGLDILGKSFLPELKKKMKNQKFEIHIFGAGELSPKLKKCLQAPEIKIRGFVEDIDKEILSAKVSLCLNSASPFKVAHTRYLHAWSMGSCVVTHQDASLSTPEIVHGKNALLGKDVSEIVDLTVKAINDAKLRAEIGEQGYQTLKKHFTSERVVSKVMDKINEFFKKKKNTNGK